MAMRVGCVAAEGLFFLQAAGRSMNPSLARKFSAGRCRVLSARLQSRPRGQRASEVSLQRTAAGKLTQCVRSSVSPKRSLPLAIGWGALWRRWARQASKPATLFGESQTAARPQPFRFFNLQTLSALLQPKNKPTWPQRSRGAQTFLSRETFAAARVRRMLVRTGSARPPS